MCGVEVAGDSDESGDGSGDGFVDLVAKVRVMDMIMMKTGGSDAFRDGDSSGGEW